MKRVLLILGLAALFIFPACEQEELIVPEFQDEAMTEDEDDDVGGPKPPPGNG